MKIYIVKSDDCNENDCGCYTESIDSIYLTLVEAVARANKLYHGSVAEYEVENT